jgi:hypothetical protein
VSSKFDERRTSYVADYDRIIEEQRARILGFVALSVWQRRRRPLKAVNARHRLTPLRAGYRLSVICQSTRSSAGT